MHPKPTASATLKPSVAQVVETVTVTKTAAAKETAVAVPDKKNTLKSSQTNEETSEANVVEQPVSAEKNTAASAKVAKQAVTVPSSINGFNASALAVEFQPANVTEPVTIVESPPTNSTATDGTGTVTATDDRGNSTAPLRFRRVRLV